MKPYLPLDQVFWYVNKKDIKPLSQNLTTDIVVVGGGIAGLTAAQSFHEKGCKVVLLEKNFCGSGASGKSSGFITPNAELSLSDLKDKFGLEGAKRVWDFTTSGVSKIKKNILEYGLDCDYQELDTLVLANSDRKFKSIVKAEYDVRSQAGYQSNLYTRESVTQVVGSSKYVGGIAYGDTFGIHAYRYCQELKKVLINQGVQIYEESPVIEIKNNKIRTSLAEVKTQYVIVCIDYEAYQMQSLWDKVYHVQTNLMLSAPLTDIQIKHIFPHKRYLVWDTDLVYNYFRLTGDSRLMLGGARIIDSYASQEAHHNTRTVRKLTNYFADKFPEVSIQFEYVWPGLIGISKDLFPIAGFDAQNKSMYYITAATGLHWGSALGAYSARRIIDQDTSFDHCFSPYRSFPLGKWANYIMGSRLPFAVSNFLTVGSF